MALTKEQKFEVIDAKRGPLLHEKYAAELDVKTAEVTKDAALEQEPKARLQLVNEQLAVLDAEEAALE